MLYLGLALFTLLVFLVHPVLGLGLLILIVLFYYYPLAVTALLLLAGIAYAYNLGD